jgi:hypothetical protein
MTSIQPIRHGDGVHTLIYGEHLTLNKGVKGFKALDVQGKGFEEALLCSVHTVKTHIKATPKVTHGCFQLFIDSNSAG